VITFTIISDIKKFTTPCKVADRHNLRLLTIFDFGRRRGWEGRVGEGRDPSSMESHDSPNEYKNQMSQL
jgi:hypothetical protein